MESIGDCSVDQLTVMYFLKVINLFEQFGYHDHVIELAQTAIAICDESDQNRVSHIPYARHHRPLLNTSHT